MPPVMLCNDSALIKQPRVILESRSSVLLLRRPLYPTRGRRLSTFVGLSGNPDDCEAMQGVRGDLCCLPYFPAV